MRRVTVAVMATLSSMALLFAYPTSHNASASSAGSGSAGGGSAAGAAVGPAAGGASPTAGASGGSGTPAAGGAASSAARTYDGAAEQTRWGVVQVRIKVQGGKVTSAQALQYPNDNSHSQDVNAYALPILDSEVIKTQSGSIDAVSGATVTSGGYISSLQSALDAAKH